MTSSLTICSHTPACPPADHPNHDEARVTDRHPEQGWSRLCNGVVVYDDTGETAPDGHPTASHRPSPPHRPPWPVVTLGTVGAWRL